MKKMLRLPALILCLLFGPVAYLLIQSQGMTYLNWFIPAAMILWLLLLGIWYLIFGSPKFTTRLFRFSGGVAAFMLFGFVASKTLRYEGSTSGSSFPKFSFVWQTKEAAAGNEEVAGVTPGAALADTTLRKAASDYTDFLGPDRNGKWASLPFDPDWDSSPPELLWRRGVGKAWSSFVVKGNKAITQQQNGDDEEVVCFDLFSGEDLWSHADSGVRLLLEKAENAGARMGGDGPRATPVISGDRVFSLGSTGIANCLNLENGSLVWRRNIIKENGGGVQRWGSANSPLVIPEENLVLYAGSDDPGATLIACDMESGDTRWVFKGDGASYSSPRVITLHGTKQVVSVNAKDVSGLSIRNGETLWVYEWPGNFPKVGQPLLAGPDTILVTASYGVGSPLLKISKTGEKWSVEQVWKSTRMKTKFSSAVVLGDHAYGLDEGRLACIDLASGRKVWKGDKYGFGQHLLFGDQLLIQAEAGFVAIGKISPEGFTESGRLSALSNMTWNVPAVAGRILLVRNDREAACYLLPEK